MIGVAVKRSPIYEAWNVNLYCDKCGEVMTYARVDYPKDNNDLHFVYKCKCGHEEMTKIQYPHQLFISDTSREEIVNG